MIAYIPLSETEFAVVDLEDVPALLDFTWCKSGSGYAHTRVPNSGKPGTRLLMHRMLCDATLVDHVNRDRLDNRRSNLRPATKQSNALNQSRQTGVGKWRGRYRAYISLNGKSKHLGVFDTYEQAVAARKAAEPKLEPMILTTKHKWIGRLT